MKKREKVCGNFTRAINGRAAGLEAVAFSSLRLAKHSTKEWSRMANSFCGDVLQAEARKLQAKNP